MEKKTRSGKKLVILLVVFGLLAAGGAAFYFLGLPALHYRQAKQLLEAGDYPAATAAFLEMGDYKDSRDMIRECDYRTAMELEADGRLLEAAAAYRDLYNYSDAAARLEGMYQALYETFVALVRDQNVEEADAYLNYLPDDYEEVRDFSIYNNIFRKNKNWSGESMPLDLTNAYQLIQTISSPQLREELLHEQKLATLSFAEGTWRLAGTTDPEFDYIFHDWIIEHRGSEGHIYCASVEVNGEVSFFIDYFSRDNYAEIEIKGDRMKYRHYSNGKVDYWFDFNRID